LNTTNITTTTIIIEVTPVIDLRLALFCIRHNINKKRQQNMRKLIAGINMTLDGFCDHTATTVDDEIHEHYNELVKSGGIMIWGRVTYQLMADYWPMVVKEPTGNAATDKFAMLIDGIQKIVYSRSLKTVNWRNTTLKNEIIPEEILELKRQPGKDIYVGSPSLIVAFSKLGLIDEYQIVVHPVVAGSGLPLFRDITERIDLELLKTKTFACGAVAMYYEPVRN
jgi:dihydrofolate reductase